MLSHTEIQGPNAMDLLLGFRRSPHQLFYELMKKHGSIVRCRLLDDLFVINHPDPARQVLMEVHQKVDKRHFINERMKRVFGNGLISSEGELWQQQRRLLAPAFHRGAVEKHQGTVEDGVQRMVTRWASRKTETPALELRKEFHQLTLEIAARTLFSFSNPDSLQFLVETMEDAAELISRTLPFNLPRWLPIPSEIRFQRLVRRIESVLRSLIAERRERPSPWPDDTLTLLLQATDSEGRKLPDDLILDEMKSLLIAGHYTTADALTWTLYSLQRDPALSETVERAAAGAPGRPLDLLLESAVNESMRLYTPVWGAWYRLREDLEVGGYRLPAGSLILVNLFNIHRNPQCFRDPETYDPSRFFPENGSTLPQAFMPFGAGPRRCIGANMAVKMMPLILRKIVQAFQIRILNTEPVGMAVRVTLTQDRPVFITVSPRS